MPFQEEIKKTLESLKEIEKTVIAFHDTQAVEYDLFLMFPRQGKNAFNDFSLELTENIGFIEAASEWKSMNEEKVTEVKKALAILIDDLSELEKLEGKVKAVDGKIKKLCEEMIAKLKTILGSMGEEREYKLRGNSLL